MTAQPQPKVLSIAVIVPAHQAVNELGQCLDGLFAAGFAHNEITVVDDGSRDGTGDVARAAGVHVLRNASALRPARARNAGVAATESDILVFVDADVVLHPGARDRIAAFFRDEPGYVALIGSYDDDPAAPRWVSRYRNLLHHHVHQTGNREASTFWTGIGAVHRAAFDAAGGLYPVWENIEDVEFGFRLIEQGGRIRLDPALQGKHLKDWTLSGMFRTDWKGRALPWTRLLRQRRARTGDLNLSIAHQISAAAVVVAAVSVMLVPFVPGMIWVALAAAAMFVTANARLLRLLASRGGPAFAVAAAFFHAVHYIAALAGYLEGRAKANVVRHRA
jgi:glycosyltransferase involved in cell wall biosynthesis